MQIDYSPIMGRDLPATEQVAESDLAAGQGVTLMAIADWCRDNGYDPRVVVEDVVLRAEAIAQRVIDAY